MSYYQKKILDFKGDTADVLTCFKDEPYVFCLDSSLFDQNRGRYSFIGFDPFYVYTADGQNSLNGLRQKYMPFSRQFNDPHTPLTAGLVGFISYDYGLRQENIKSRLDKEGNIPEILFGFYDAVLTIDHRHHKIYITSTGLPETVLGLRKERAKTRLDYILNKLNDQLKIKDPADDVYFSSVNEEKLNFKTNFTQTEYIQTIEKALEYIREGDIYQLNLSQRFELNNDVGLAHCLDIYKTLRKMSAACFNAYFDAGDFKIMSSSPERFISKRGNLLQTQPMKGTRARGKNFLEDMVQKKELTNSAKDKAELLMITDLERNDLGRVCEYGTIRVDNLREIEEYKTVYQAVSTIEGKLKKEKDVFDVLEACFPGGSITGCPKIRSMQIIDKLEPNRRGLYTGCLGYINFNGDMDFNILIRTIAASSDKLYFQVGSAIVADSNPQDEYQETLIKAKAIIDCLNQVFSKNKYCQNA